MCKCIKELQNISAYAHAKRTKNTVKKGSTVIYLSTMMDMFEMLKKMGEPYANIVKIAVLLMEFRMSNFLLPNSILT